MTGPYAHVRNPLYLGSMLIAAGFAVALMSWPFAVVLVVFFLLIYVPVIASEEKFLRGEFLEFEWYCARVPRLIPRLTPARAPDGDRGNPGSFSLQLYRKHREYNSAIGAALLYCSLLLAILLHARDACAGHILIASQGVRFWPQIGACAGNDELCYGKRLNDWTFGFLLPRGGKGSCGLGNRDRH
jgi:hypothetical protein